MPTNEASGSSKPHDTLHWCSMIAKTNLPAARDVTNLAQFCSKLFGARFVGLSLPFPHSAEPTWQ